MASGDDKKSFKSFKDLLKKSGDAPPEPEVDEGPGWTLETAQDQPSEEATRELLDTDPGPRAIIDARPAGFAAMDTGPKPYRDTESEEMQLLHSFRVRTVFPEDVLGEVDALPQDPDPAEYGDRVDLRGETIFTIDGADAKDYDDAIAIRALEDGEVELGVHIADVSHYVRPGTALDSEALARGTSVYLADQVVPMLPEGLSNHLCSLVPNRPRFAYSVIMRFDAKGERIDARVHKSVIQSVQRNTYKAVQELLDREDTAEAREIKHLEQPLRLFEAWTRQQQKLRDQRGSLRMQSTEKKFVFDEQHEVVGVVDAPRYFSQTLIEETALAANQAVGDLFRQRGLPTIYRVHPEKDPEEMAAVARLLGEHGLRVPDKDRLTGRDIARLITAARRKQNAEALIQRIMGLIERAVYEVHDHEDVATHFGLAREAYLHFTSPIRRYPDLIVHRWLHAIESRGEAAEEELKTDLLVQDLNDMAAHCSMQADIAEMAERAIGDLKVCQYMDPHVGEKMEAKVMRVMPPGMEVLLIEYNVTAFLPTRAIGDLKVCQYMDPHVGEKMEAKVMRVMPPGMEVLLTEYNVTAFLPTRSIGDRGVVKGPTLTVHKGRTARSFSEGYPISVRLKDVDFIRLQLTLDLA